MLTADKLTANIRIERRGRLFDTWIDGHFSNTRDITDFFNVPEEEVDQAVAYLDEQDRQEAEASG
jgi:hypothetical protein